MTTVTSLSISRAIKASQGGNEIARITYMPISPETDGFVVLYDTDVISSSRMLGALEALLTKHFPGKIVQSGVYFRNVYFMKIIQNVRLNNAISTTIAFTSKLTELLKNTKHINVDMRNVRRYDLDLIDLPDNDFGQNLCSYLHALDIDPLDISSLMSAVHMCAQVISGDYLVVYVSKMPPNETCYVEGGIKTFGKHMRVYQLADGNLWIWLQ